MIELPEALVIARQMNEVLAGKRIAYGNRGNATHKFAFSSGSSEEYEAIFQGKRVGRAEGHGSAILASIGQGHKAVPVKLPSTYLYWILAPASCPVALTSGCAHE